MSKFAKNCGMVRTCGGDMLFNTLFPVVNMCLIYSPTKLCDGARMANFWRLLRPVGPISASRVQHISDLHPKFAVRPHHVWKYGRHPICDG